MSSGDPSRIPVVAGIGQAIERNETVDAVEMGVRAARAAFEEAPGLADHIERVTMVGVSFSPASRAPASEAAARLGLKDVRCEVSNPGGNLPQWLVTRAAADIAAGELDTTLILGGEATRSMRAGDPGADFLSVAVDGLEEAAADPVVGPSLDGMLSEAESAARLRAPAEVYPMLESARAYAAGRSFLEQRAFLAELMARFTEVAARNPFAWFPEARRPDEIATPSASNRLTAEPYTKRMNSFPNVDLGSALLVTNLARARAAGLEDRCVFPWAGASNSESPVAARQRPGESLAVRAAGEAALRAAGIGIDDVAHIDIYSCFPVAVEAAAEGLGLAFDDPRGLTSTGGMAFFGGPGNNYSGHGIAAVVEKVRASGDLGLVTANGGYLSKQSIGVYGARPAEAGFRAVDTSAEQAEIQAAALPVTVEAEGEASVEAATVVYGRDGEVARAPVVARLADGRRLIADADPAALADLAGVSLVGRSVRVSGKPLLYQP